MDSGQIFKNGHRISFNSPKKALEFGISTVFQELSLLANLTIAENMFLGREPLTRFGAVDYAGMNAQTADALAQLGLTLVSVVPASEFEGRGWRRGQRSTIHYLDD